MNVARGYNVGAPTRGARKLAKSGVRREAQVKRRDSNVMRACPPGGAGAAG